MFPRCRMKIDKLPHGNPLKRSLFSANYLYITW